MTAIVAVMNKSGIAVSADSAVTITNNQVQKVYNNANKIITLSKYEPIGVMIYNSASFIGTPWEIIIKLYRKQLQEDKFNTVTEYAEDFFSFLESESFFSTNDQQKENILEYISNIFKSIMNNAFELNGNKIDIRDLQPLKTFIKKSIDELNQAFKDKKPLSNLEKYTINQFKSHIDGWSEYCFKTDTPELLQIFNEYKDLFEDCFYNFICKTTHPFDFTGLIFVGYGETEIFPSIQSYNISGVLDGNLLVEFKPIDSAQISHKNSSSIKVFAQTDVIETILVGYESRLYNSLFKNTEVIISKIFSEIRSITKENIDIYNKIEHLTDSKQVLKLLQQVNSEDIQKENIIPLLNAIATLSKEDMTNLTESLISITSLKRRITFSQESVGGPVDTAMVTKGDGFIWIKRKHYFNPDLNYSYIEKYLK